MAIPQQTKRQDPSDKLPYVVDWSAWLGDTATITSSTFAIDGPDTALTKDNEGLVTGNQKTTVRLLGGTVGKKYTITNHIVTNESPTREKDWSWVVYIEQE